MRATDGRPYELQSVPIKTVAVRSTDNCADLVQELCLHLVGKRQFHGFAGSFDTGRLQYMYRQERTCASENAFPLRGRCRRKPTDEV